MPHQALWGLALSQIRLRAAHQGLRLAGFAIQIDEGQARCSVDFHRLASWTQLHRVAHHTFNLIADALGVPFTDIDANDAAPWSQNRAKVARLTQKTPKAFMPAGNEGAVQGEDLELILAWANAWRAARRATHVDAR